MDPTIEIPPHLLRLESRRAEVGKAGKTQGAPAGWKGVGRWFETPPVSGNVAFLPLKTNGCVRK